MVVFKSAAVRFQSNISRQGYHFVSKPITKTTISLIFFESLDQLLSNNMEISTIVFMHQAPLAYKLKLMNCGLRK